MLNWILKSQLSKDTCVITDSSLKLSAQCSAQAKKKKKKKNSMDVRKENH